jgi:hypothetical protein
MNKLKVAKLKVDVLDLVNQALVKLQEVSNNKYYDNDSLRELVSMKGDLETMIERGEHWKLIEEQDWGSSSVDYNTSDNWD